MQRRTERNAVWAVDLSVDPQKVRSFELKAGSGWGLGGPVIGNDGAAYAQTADGLPALSPRDVQLKQDVSLHGSNLLTCARYRAVIL